MKYARVVDGVIQQTLKGSYVPAGGWVEVPDNAEPLMKWDGQNLLPADPLPAPGPRMRLSKREFRNQFTFAEKQAIYTAAESNVDVRIFLDDLMAVDFVDLDFPDTMAAVNSLEVAGLLASGRASEILSGLME